MIFGQRIQRYIFRECLISALVAVGIISAAILLVDVVEQLRTVGDVIDISLFTAIYLAVLKLPMLIEQTMPFLILVSSIIVFSRLSRLAELPAMRAAGLSAWKFLAPLAMLALLLGLITTFLLNPVGSHLNANFEQTREDLLGSQAQQVYATNNGIWLRQGSENDQFVIYAKSTEQRGVVLKDVKIFEYERIYNVARPAEKYAFKQRIEAETATLKDGFWELKGVIEHTAGVTPVRKPALSIPTNLDPAKLLDRFASTSTIGFWQLPQFIKDTKNAGLDALRYEMQYHALLAYPILYVAMALIGALVCLRLARLGGTAQLIAWGAFAAVLLYFINELTQSLGAAGAIPTIVAAFSPPVFALFAALTAIAYLEDG